MKKHADTDLFFRGEFPEYKTSVEEIEEARKIKAYERRKISNENDPEPVKQPKPIHLSTSRKCHKCGNTINGVQMSKYVNLYKCFACGSETFDVIVIKNAAK